MSEPTDPWVRDEQHHIAWADDRVASVYCSGSDAGVQLFADDPPYTCLTCGATLRLHWDVWVERLEAK